MQCGAGSGERTATLLTGFDLCRAALAVEGITAPEQAVLTTLAIMANDDAQCWPPINGPTGLTSKTKLSERAVQRAIQRLKDLGHLTRRQLRHGCVYTIHPKPTPATLTGVGETGDTGTGVSEAPRPATLAPKQPVTTNTHPKASPSSGKRDRTNATRVSANFVPAPAIGSLTAKAMDAWPPGERDEQVEHFVDHHTAAGTLSKDWQASWRTWVKNWKRFNGNRSHRAGRGQGGSAHAHPGGRIGAAADRVFGSMAD